MKGERTNIKLCIIKDEKSYYPCNRQHQLAIHGNKNGFFLCFNLMFGGQVIDAQHKSLFQCFFATKSKYWNENFYAEKRHLTLKRYY